MGVLNLGVRAKITGFSRWSEVMPQVVQVFESIENWTKGRVGTDNFTDSSVTTAKIADGAVTPAKTSGGVARADSGQYTGDGTANREVNLGFRPRYVWVIRHDTSMVFESVGSTSAAMASGRRTSTGTWTGSGVADADWQGCSANGFLLGSGGTGGLSNASGQTYSWFAVR